MRISRFNQKDSLSVGILLLLFIGWIFFFFSALFFFHLPVSLHSSVSCLIFFLLVFWAFGRKLSDYFQLDFSFRNFFTALLVVFVCLGISGSFYDYSYDGQSYHGEAIIQLAGGWNPVYEYIPGDSLITVVINHFPKASWIIGAFFYKLTGDFEMAKAGNGILMAMNFFIAYSFFRIWLNRFAALALALLLALNPICLNMYLSNMLDGQAANLLFAFFILLYFSFKTDRKSLFWFVSIPVIYTLNLKFTWVGYYFIFIAATVAYLILLKKPSEKWKWSAGLIAFYTAGCLVFGYATYVKNFTHFEHPFYPFKGKTNIGMKYVVGAKDYMEGSRLINFVKSNFAQTTYADGYNNPLHYKWPLTFSRYEIERYAFAGVMIGGFGVWFSAILSFSLLLLLMTLLQGLGGRKNLLLLLSFLGMVLLTILINPLGYIARYIPQYFFLPFLFIVYYVHYGGRFKLILAVMIVLMFVNAFLINGYTYYNMIVSRTLKSQIRELKQSQKSLLVNFGQHHSKRILLEQNGIVYKEVPLTLLGYHPDTLFRSEVVFVKSE